MPIYFVEWYDKTFDEWFGKDLVTETIKNLTGSTSECQLSLLGWRQKSLNSWKIINYPMEVVYIKYTSFLIFFLLTCLSQIRWRIIFWFGPRETQLVLLNWVLHNLWRIFKMHHVKLWSMVSCQKGPTCNAYAWQIGPFWQDTLVISLQLISASLELHWDCFIFYKSHINFHVLICSNLSTLVHYTSASISLIISWIE